MGLIPLKWEVAALNWGKSIQLLVLGRGAWSCRSVFHAVPMGQPYGDSRVKAKCVSRWEACGWISQAAPTILPFPPAEKMWDPDFCAILTSFSSAEEMLRDLKKKKTVYFVGEVLFVFPLVIVIQEMAMGPLPWHHLFSHVQANNLQC